MVVDIKVGGFMEMIYVGAVEGGTMHLIEKKYWTVAINGGKRVFMTDKKETLEDAMRVTGAILQSEENYKSLWFNFYAYDEKPELPRGTVLLHHHNSHGDWERILSEWTKET